jgi:hypothetical protein
MAIIMVTCLAPFVFLGIINDSNSYHHHPPPHPSLSSPNRRHHHRYAVRPHRRGALATTTTEEAAVEHPPGGWGVGAPVCDGADDLFASQLGAAGLSWCHGILHASGCRRMSDVAGLTRDQMSSMGASASDREIMIGIVSTTTGGGEGHRDDCDGDGDGDGEEVCDGPSSDVVAPSRRPRSSSMLSTTVFGDDGAGFDPHFSDGGFEFEVICAENGIFKGEWDESF